MFLCFSLAGGVCVLRIVWMFAVLPAFPGIDTIMLSYLVSWAITSVLFIIYYIKKFPKPEKGNGNVKSSGNGDDPFPDLSFIGRVVLSALDITQKHIFFYFGKLFAIVKKSILFFDIVEQLFAVHHFAFY